MVVVNCAARSVNCSSTYRLSFLVEHANRQGKSLVKDHVDAQDGLARLPAERADQGWRIFVATANDIFFDSGLPSEVRSVPDKVTSPLASNWGGAYCCCVWTIRSIRWAGVRALAANSTTAEVPQERTPKATIPPKNSPNDPSGESGV